MTLEPIKQLLRTRLGIDSETLSQIGLRANVRRRMEARGVGTQSGYAELLKNDDVEFQTLVNTIVVHETSFFRYPASFGLLESHALERAKLPGALPLRVLCVACSTGEEPASAVMTLLSGGLDPSQIRVDAVDLSERAIAYARAGRYRSRGVERLPKDIRSRWFKPDESGYRISPEVLACIQFRQANALAHDFLADEQTYDVIFCRNLLIYLVPDAREALLRRLVARMRPRALLLVGHAEVPAVRALGLPSAPPPDAFALRRVQTLTRRPAPASIPRLRQPFRSVLPPAPSGSRPPAQVRPQAVSESGVSDFARAARLADTGELEEARRILSRLIANGGAGADHYHLLAVIEGARGREVATSDALRRALYLNPEHYPALVQLALLADARGDRDDARRARAKAERVREAWHAAQGEASKGGSA